MQHFGLLWHNQLASAELDVQRLALVCGRQENDDGENISSSMRCDTRLVVMSLMPGAWPWVCEKGSTRGQKNNSNSILRVETHKERWETHCATSPALGLGLWKAYRSLGHIQNVEILIVLKSRAWPWYVERCQT